MIKIESNENVKSLFFKLLDAVYFPHLAGEFIHFLLQHAVSRHGFAASLVAFVSRRRNSVNQIHIRCRRLLLAVGGYVIPGHLRPHLLV